MESVQDMNLASLDSTTYTWAQCAQMGFNPRNFYQSGDPHFHGRIGHMNCPLYPDFFLLYVLPYTFFSKDHQNIESLKLS